MPPAIKHTYGSRSARTTLPSSPPSSPPPLKRKRPLDQSAAPNTPPAKRPRSDTLAVPKVTAKVPAKKGQSKGKGKGNGKGKQNGQPQKKLTQLHFAIDTTVLRTCDKCDLSYTKGAPDDESLHRRHCARVQRGLEWGREEQREAHTVAVEEIATAVKLKNGEKGRIICFRADVGGKIGAKLVTLLETIALALSSPPLSPAVLKHCKIYLFLLRVPSSASTTAATSSREKIVGCVVAQRITTAMAIASSDDLSERSSPAPSASSSSPATPHRHPLHSLIPVDTSTNLYVHPAPLPTSLGIPRLFVSAAHRRQGIAAHLLDAATQTFILGCTLDPARGDVAFTQPTGAGKAVLETWGRGGVRIYEEEQFR